MVTSVNSRKTNTKHTYMKLLSDGIGLKCIYLKLVKKTNLYGALLVLKSIKNCWKCYTCINIIIPNPKRSSNQIFNQYTMICREFSSFYVTFSHGKLRNLFTYNSWWQFLWSIYILTLLDTVIFITPSGEFLLKNCFALRHYFCGRPFCSESLIIQINYINKLHEAHVTFVSHIC